MPEPREEAIMPQEDKEFKELNVLLQNYKNLIKEIPVQEVYGPDADMIDPEKQERKGFDPRLFDAFNELAKKFGRILVSIDGDGQFYPDRIAVLLNGTVLLEKKDSPDPYYPDELTYEILSKEEGEEMLRELRAQLQKQISKAQEALEPIDDYLKKT